MTSSPPMLEELADLVKAAGAHARLRPGRIVTSTLYDLDYRVAVIACALHICGEGRQNGTRGVLSHWLQLIQFVAARPGMLPEAEQWASERRRRTHEDWLGMPRGYVEDEVHNRVVELLVATSVLRRNEGALEGGARFAALTRIYQQVEKLDLLGDERAVLTKMATMKPNMTLVQGN